MRLSIVAAALAFLAIPTISATASRPTQGGQGAHPENADNRIKPDGPCFDNTNRYVNCGNGTVTDTVTGLIWLQYADCLAVNDWAAANQAVAGLRNGECNLTDKSRPGDWRVPTKDEWSATTAAAIALGCVRFGSGAPPSLTNDPGTGCLSAGPTSFVFLVPPPIIYWSSTSVSEIGGFSAIAAWTVDLRGGFDIFSKDGLTRPWPVRSGSR
jgi:Protein of unknown function (DUF1566)